MSNKKQEIDQDPFNRQGLFMKGKTILKPPVDIGENENEYTIGITVPGYERDDIEVKATDGILTIKAERKPPDSERKKTRLIDVDRKRQDLRRSFKIPNDVKKNSISSDYHSGTLTITLPKESRSEDKFYYRV